MVAAVGLVAISWAKSAPAWALTRPIATVRSSALTAASLTPLTYHNGKVISPHIVCLMWGSFSPQDVLDNQAYLIGLQQFMSNHDLTGGVEPTHRQYGTWGAYFSGTCTVDSSTPTGVIGAAAIKAEIIAMQNRATNPLEPYSPQSVVLVFTKGITMDANYGQNTSAGWCAYHDTAGTDKYWAIIPFPTVTACFFGVTGTQALQKGASHELFEAATDPDLSKGWYAGTIKQEIGDDCNGSVSLVTLPNGVAGAINPMVDNISQSCEIFSPAQTPPLSVVKTGTNTINVFAQDQNGVPMQISGDGVNWGSPQNRGGIITEAPTAISVDGQTIDMFARGTDGAVWRWFFDGSSWSGPSWMGGFVIGPPSATFKTSPGRLVYAMGTDGLIYVLTGAGNSWTWSLAGVPPGGVRAISPPQAFFRNANCSDIYFTGTNGHLYMQANCTDTPFWSDLGGIVLNRVSEASRPSNTARVDIFVDGPVVASGAVPFQKSINPSTGFLNLGGIVVGAPSSVALGSSAIRLFARGSGGRAGSGLYQDITANGSTWGGWGQLDTVSISSAPLAFTPDNSAINVFLRRTDRELVQKRFDGANWQSIQDLNLRVR